MQLGAAYEFLPKNWIVCPSCGGSGKERIHKYCCEACGGLGRMPDPMPSLCGEAVAQGLFDFSLRSSPHEFG